MAASHPKRRHKVRRRADMALLGGIRPPIAALSAFVLALAGTTALTLGSVEDEAIPEAVLTSQQHFAEDGAVALRASLDENINDLRRVAGHFSDQDPVSGDTVLDGLGDTHQKRRGTAVFELGSGKLLAARGEAVPFGSIDRHALLEDGGLDPRLVELPSGESRLLTLAPLSWEGEPQQILATTTSLRFPGGAKSTERSLAVVDASGTILSGDGLATPTRQNDDEDSGPRTDQAADHGPASDAPRPQSAHHRPGHLLDLPAAPFPSTKEQPAHDQAAPHEPTPHELVAARASSHQPPAEQDVQAAHQQLRTFAKQAADGGEGASTTNEPGPAGYPGLSGSLVGDRIGAERAVAGFASLAPSERGEGNPTAELGLTVVSMVKVSESPLGGVDPVHGLIAAVALLVTGGLVVLTLLAGVQRPLLRLYLESRRLVRGDLSRPVEAPRFGEGARVAAGLERLRRQLLGERPRGQGSDGGNAASTRSRRTRRRLRMGTPGLLLLCAALMLAWSAPLAFLVNRADDAEAVPDQLVQDQRDRTQALSDRVRRALNEGHSDLSSAARLVGSTAPKDRMNKVLERTAHEHPRYESLYVIDSTGERLAQTGKEPRHPRGEGTRAEPLTLLNESGKIPVLMAYAGIPGGKGATLVGEFRTDFLNSLLDQSGLGQTRLVDSELRTVGGDSGFLAFEKLPSDPLASLAEQAREDDGDPRSRGTRYQDSGQARLAAAAPFDGGGPAAELGWSVVSWQTPNAMALPAYMLQNRTILAGLLGLTATVACLGWLHIVVVRPLRELVEQVEALADGDRRTVLYPRHHDEVGAIARSLELIRQQLQTQPKRDGASVLAGRN